MIRHVRYASSDCDRFVISNSFFKESVRGPIVHASIDGQRGEGGDKLDADIARRRLIHLLLSHRNRYR